MGSAYRKDNHGPPVTALRRLFGDSAKAYKAAGVPPPTRSHAQWQNNLRLQKLAQLEQQSDLTVRCVSCEWVKTGLPLPTLELQTRHIREHGVKRQPKFPTHSYA